MTVRERDPRVDPRAGDEVLVFGELRTVIEVDQGYVLFDSAEHGRQTTDLSYWRRRVDGATILHVAQEKP